MIAHLLKKYPTLLPICLILLVIILPHWKLATMQGYVITDDIFTSDIMNEGFPYRHYIGEALSRGEAPVWLPYIYGGMPLLARAEAGAAYPPNLLLFGLLHPYSALNISILLTLIIAGIGMFLYTREIGSSTVGAMIAAVAFAYSGFMVSHMKHLSMVATVSWFPLGLFLLERAAQHGEAGSSKRATTMFLWFGVAFGIQTLAGHIQVAYYSALVYIVCFLTRIVRWRQTPRKERSVRPSRTSIAPPSQTPVLLGFLVSLLVGAGISAVQVLPTYELVGLTQRAEGVGFDYASSYAYDPANITTFFYPYGNGDIGNGTYRGQSIFWEDYGYVGLFTLLLALYAAIRHWKTWHVKFFSLTALVAYLLVVGPATPLYEAVFHVVPGMKYFRFPTRFLFVVDASLAVLAAIGVTRLFEGRKNVSASKSDSPRPLEFGVLGLVVADLLFFQLRQNPIVDAESWLTPPRTVTVLQQDSSLFRIYSPGGSETHKAAFAAARGWQGSLQPYIDQREFVQVSSNVLYGISSADGYAQLTPNYVVDIWGDQNRSGLIMQTARLQEGTFMPLPSFVRIMNLFNVKYILSPWPMGGEWFEEMPKVGQVYMYRNTSFMPRVFLVGGYREAATPDEARRTLLSDGFDPAREAILYHRPSHDPRPVRDTDLATVEHYSTNEVIVNVSVGDDALLVLSDTFYPGWKVYVDGVEEEMLHANICQRAVAVPAGRHTVRFVFESPVIMAGLVLTLVSFFAVAGGIVLLGRSKT